MGLQKLLDDYRALGNPPEADDSDPVPTNIAGSKADRARSCGAAPWREAPRRGVNRRRQCHDLAERTKPPRKIEVFENRNVAVTVELFENIAPDENGLVAEMPAPETIAQAGEPAGERERERWRTITPGESSAEGAPPIDRLDNPGERVGRQPGVSVKKKQDASARLHRRRDSSAARDGAPAPAPLDNPRRSRARPSHPRLRHRPR